MLFTGSAVIICSSVNKMKELARISITTLTRSLWSPVKCTRRCILDSSTQPYLTNYRNNCHLRNCHNAMSLNRYRCGRPTIYCRSAGTESSDDNILSSDEGSSSNHVLVFQPNVLKIKYITQNEFLEVDESIEDKTITSSVERDTIYTRQNVTTEDPTVQALLSGIMKGSRGALAQAITLAESIHPHKKAQAQVLLKEVLDYMRTKQKHSLHKINSFRIGKSIQTVPNTPIIVNN